MILFCYADHPSESWNSSLWRCDIPSTALSGAGHESTLFPIQHLSQAPEADLYILEREVFGPNLLEALKLKKSGHKVVVTLDDNYWLLAPENKAFKTWHEGRDSEGKFLGFNPLEDLERAIGEFGAVTPSDKLTQFISNFGNSRTIPNYLPDKPVVFKPTVSDLLWSGNATHQKSWEGSGLITAIEKSGRHLTLNTSDVVLLDKLSSLYHNYFSWIPFSDYLSFASQFRVGLAPLVGEYDSCRSSVKVLAYARAGLPWVASDLAPYSSARGGILVRNTSEAWMKGFEAVEANYEHLRNEGLAWASTRLMSQHIGSYLTLAEM